MKQLFDRVQVWLYLSGFTKLAGLIGRLGSSPVTVDEEPITLRSPVALEPVTLSGEKLKVLDFDPRFKHNDPSIDPTKDVAFGKTRLDIN